MTFKDAVIYQIYPRSFADSDGDGIGDLPGILSRLDYLADLGVDVLWLSPIFASPNADNGYDISDYEAIMPQFGTMADFDALLAGVHRRGMRLVLDLVVNHSSDEHDWFQQSRQDKTNPYRDYYIWRPPSAAGGPPNDWQSFFSGPAWQFDAQTGEYYLHLFAKKQPDLNWEHPPLRQAIYRMMRFWLDKGVDGFRMDVIPFLSKDPAFPDYPAGRSGDLTIYANGPRIHEFLTEMNREVMQHYSCMTIGEGFGVSADQANLYVGRDRHELDMIYHFDHAVPREEQRFVNPAPEFTLPQLKAVFARWNDAISTEGWQNIYFGNHDNPRVLSRFGSLRFPRESATLLATVLLTQRGTPTIYQGDELGMTNCRFDSIDEFDDIQVKNAWQTLVASGKYPASVFLETANQIARDHARTPMQWTNVLGEFTLDEFTPGAGFTTGMPWLKVNPNHAVINVARQEQDPQSVLNFYRRLLRWRKQMPVLHEGLCHDLLPDHPTLWAFDRILTEQRLVIVANVSEEATPLPDALIDSQLIGTPIFVNYATDFTTTLRPFEVRVYAG